MKSTSVLCLLVLFVILTGGATPAGSQEKVLVYGRGADSEKLDPQDVEDGESVKVILNLFDTLVTYGPDSPAIVPSLAESWEHSADGKTWTFRLRAGVKFHDGTPLDAAAVVFSFDRLLRPENPHRHDATVPYASFYGMIDQVAAPDAHTAVFTLKQPSAVFLANLAMFPAAIVSPAGLVEKQDRFPFEPVGSGPFKLVTWDRNERIVLAANPDYWGGRPVLDKVIFRPIPENSVRFQLLKSGEVDLIDGLNLSDLETVQQDSTLQLLETPGMNFGYLAMNTGRKPFDQAGVRQAICHAVDRDKIIKLALRGHGSYGANPMPPTVWSYHQGLTGYAYDPAKAKALLEQAGLGAGFEADLWAMPNPRPYMPEPQKVAQIIQEDLRAVGIRTKIVSYDWQTYREKVRHGEHDMCLLGWITDNGDPDNFLYALLDSDNAVPGTALNISFYKNDQVHQLLLGAQTQLDADLRLKLYHDAQTRILADAPMLPLAYLPEFAAARKRVQNYRLHPIGLVRLKSVTLQD